MQVVFQSWRSAKVILTWFARSQDACKLFCPSTDWLLPSYTILEFCLLSFRSIQGKYFFFSLLFISTLTLNFLYWLTIHKISIVPILSDLNELKVKMFSFFFSHARIRFDASRKFEGKFVLFDKFRYFYVVGR